MHSKFSEERKKQLLYGGVFIAAGAAVVVLLGSVFQPDKPQAPIETPKIDIINKKDTDASTFRKQFANSDAQQSAQIKALQEALAAMQNGNAAAVPGQPAGQQPLPMAMQAQNSVANMIVPPPPPTEVHRLPEPPKESEEIKREVPKTIVMENMIGSIAVATPHDVEAKPKEAASKTKKIEIPSGSFMGGVLLSGIDAPTGGKAKTGPHPVLIKVTNMTRLPNKFKANLKECHIVGSGYGDLSSERAFVRVEKLTCMTEDGRAVEKGAAGQSIGYVAGEDGKVGLPGRVVSKQGAILARTLAAGFLEGVSKGFSQSNMTYSVQPTGSIATPDPGDTMQMGLFNGVGEASKKLADFYMKLANEMFPVVEISAGRKVDVVLLEKVTFELNEGRK